jgi:hypothetical protein
VKTRTIGALLAFVSASCGEEHLPVACPAYAAAGVAVSVSNTSNGQPICDATVTATDGAYSEQFFGPACTFTGAVERPGTYVVRATRHGFAPNEVAPVRVVMSGGECPHVQETRVTIELTPDGLAAPR